MRATKQPWFRIDVFRGCKTGEIIEATPRSLAQKLRIVALGALLGVPLVAASQWFFKVWTPRYQAELGALAKTDPVASARKLAEFASLLLLAPVLSCVVVSLVVVIRATRLVRAGRRPLPGDKVRVRTEVVAGWWCVRFPAILWGASALACMLMVWTSYVWLIGFFWNGYLDKVAASRTSGAIVAMRSPADSGHGL